MFLTTLKANKRRIIINSRKNSYKAFVLLSLGSKDKKSLLYR